MKLEVNNLTKYRPDLKLIKSAAAEFARVFKISKDKELSLALAGEAEIKRLNRIYRGRDQVTDILSFAGEENFLGELVINYGQIKRQAKQSRVSVRRELVFILTHGLLHLIGYDDKTEAGRRKMIELGEKFVRKLKM